MDQNKRHMGSPFTKNKEEIKGEQTNPKIHCFQGVILGGSWGHHREETDGPLLGSGAGGEDWR